MRDPHHIVLVPRQSPVCFFSQQDVELSPHSEIVKGKQTEVLTFITLFLIEMPFDSFANRADPDEAALVRAATSGSTVEI